MTDQNNKHIIACKYPICLPLAGWGRRAGRSLAESRRTRGLLLLFAAVAGVSLAAPVEAEQLQVAYAGSMGVVMDRFLGPRFAAGHSSEYRGIGQGAYALARLIQSRQIRPDVFVSVTRGPVDLLLHTGLLREAQPVASTEMVITYDPKSRFAARFRQAAAGELPWYTVLESPGLRFGRTDPATDPQGRNIIFTFLLAERYYRHSGLVEKILGQPENPAQIFTEPSLLSRLEAGQLDASSAYRSSAVSHGLPYITLPPEINLGYAGYEKDWYSKAEFSVRAPSGKREILMTQPLVFYAGVPVDARHPDLGRAFVAFLMTQEAQRLLRRHGYGPPTGNTLQ